MATVLHSEHYMQPFEGITVPSFAGLQTGAQPLGSLPDAKAEAQGKIWTPRENEACFPVPKCFEANWLLSQTFDASDFLQLNFVDGGYVPLKHSGIKNFCGINCSLLSDASAGGHTRLKEKPGKPHSGLLQ